MIGSFNRCDAGDDYVDHHTFFTMVADRAGLNHVSFEVHDVNWVSIAQPTEPIRVAIKIRHRHEPAPATLCVLNDDLIEATFDEPQRAITPGQSAVFYQGDEVAGGGWIF